MPQVLHLRLADEVRAFFDKGGPLSQVIDGYAPRPTQVEMAVAVADAITERRHLAVEAPTGTGKSFAYGVPAILHVLRDKKRFARECSNENAPKPARIIIATANIALQEQLATKDLPALQKLIGGFSFAVAKGMSNYLCLEAVFGKKQVDEQRAFDRMLGEDPNLAGEVRDLHEWAALTKSGDKSELKVLPSDAAWSTVSTTSDDCKGKKGCSHADACHMLRARQAVKDADIVVTNYHLLCLDLAYRGPVLGNAPIVICDEAHRLAGVARQTYGTQIGAGSIGRLSKRLKDFNRELSEDLNLDGESFINKLETYASTDAYNDVCILEPNTAPDWQRIARALGRASVQFAELSTKLMGEAGGADAEGSKSKHAQAAKARRASYKCRDMEHGVVSSMQLHETHVYSIEQQGRSRRPSLRSRMLDPAGPLSDFLIDAKDTVVATSATLSAGGNLDFFAHEVGLVDYKALIVDSPFDYPKQAALVVPSTMPSPKHKDYSDAVSKHVCEFLGQAHGRVLCLFTSRARLKAAASAWRARRVHRTGHVILAQGESSNRVILEKFKQSPDAALFGTLSFFEGVDVPGMAAVIIDRVPFPMMSDPVHFILSNRPSGFRDYSLPKAAIVLKQGFGRLIRRTTDRGVVMVLDTRLTKARYGDYLIQSLPEVPIYSSIEAYFKKQCSA